MSKNIVEIAKKCLDMSTKFVKGIDPFGRQSRSVYRICALIKITENACLKQRSKGDFPGRKCLGNSTEISKKFQGNVTEMLRNVKENSSKIPRNVQDISEMFPEHF